MKKDELKRALEDKRVPKELYNLDGTGRNDERFCLQFNNKWEVYFCERGIKTTDLIFDTEEEACQYIFETLVD